MPYRQNIGICPVVLKINRHVTTISQKNHKIIFFYKPGVGADPAGASGATAGAGGGGGGAGGVF